MKVKLDDFRAILDYMVDQRWQGNEYVAFPHDSFSIAKEDLTFFDNQYDVQEFCYEMSTDVDLYDYLAIRTVYGTMGEAMLDKSFYIVNNGLIDVGEMINARMLRLEVHQNINDKNNNVMNQKNLEYLTDQVKYTGFGEGLSESLKQKIEKGGDEFRLNHETKYNNDTVQATLNFSKSKSSDMYFFNSYDVSIQKEGNTEKLDQTFYINKGSNITLKEAYNLMDGRSVNKNLTNKDGELYNTWVKLDFEHTDNKGNFRVKKFTETYGFDINEALSKHPIKELSRDDFKDDLIDSLKKGNLQSVTFLVDNAEQKHFVAAEPQFKTIKVFDADMKTIGNRKEQSEKEAQEEAKSSKRTQKQAPEGDPEQSKQKAKKSSRLKA